MSTIDGITYTFKQVSGKRVICISGPEFGDDAVLDRPNLVIAIEKIKANHSSYFTEEAYTKHLKRYQQALHLWDAEVEAA